MWGPQQPPPPLLVALCGNKFSCLINWPTIFLSDIYLNLFLTEQRQINSPAVAAVVLLCWRWVLRSLIVLLIFLSYAPAVRAQEFPSAASNSVVKWTAPSRPEMPPNEIFADTKWHRFTKSQLSDPLRNECSFNYGKHRSRRGDSIN